MAGEQYLYFCIDIEASGPVPGFYNMVSLGAVPVARGNDGRWAPMDQEYYAEIKPDFDGYLPDAMKIHGLSKEHLEANGKHSRDVMVELRSWTKELAHRKRAVFVGHNAPFDWMYVAYYFAMYDIKNVYGYNALDTKALAMGKLGLEWFETSKERLETLLADLEPQDTTQTHNAVYDARYQAEILSALLNL